MEWTSVEENVCEKDIALKKPPPRCIFSNWRSWIWELQAQMAENSGHVMPLLTNVRTSGDIWNLFPYALTAIKKR